MTNEQYQIILLMDEGFRILNPEKRKKLKTFLEQANPGYAFYPIATLEELAALSALEREAIRNRVEMVVLGMYNLPSPEVKRKFGDVKIRFVDYLGATQEYIGEVGQEIRNSNALNVTAG